MLGGAHIRLPDSRPCFASAPDAGRSPGGRFQQGALAGPPLALPARLPLCAGNGPVLAPPFQGSRDLAVRFWRELKAESVSRGIDR